MNWRRLIPPLGFLLFVTTVLSWPSSQPEPPISGDTKPLAIRLKLSDRPQPPSSVRGLALWFAAEDATSKPFGWKNRVDPKAGLVSMIEGQYPTSKEVPGKAKALEFKTLRDFLALEHYPITSKVNAESFAGFVVGRPYTSLLNNEILGAGSGGGQSFTIEFPFEGNVQLQLGSERLTMPKPADFYEHSQILYFAKNGRTLQLLLLTPATGSTVFLQSLAQGRLEVVEGALTLGKGPILSGYEGLIHEFLFFERALDERVRDEVFSYLKKKYEKD